MQSTLTNIRVTRAAGGLRSKAVLARLHALARAEPELAALQCAEAAQLHHEDAI